MESGSLEIRAVALMTGLWRDIEVKKIISIHARRRGGKYWDRREFRVPQHLFSAIFGISGFCRLFIIKPYGS